MNMQFAMNGDRIGCGCLSKFGWGEVVSKHQHSTLWIFAQTCRQRHSPPIPWLMFRLIGQRWTQSQNARRHLQQTDNILNSIYNAARTRTASQARSSAWAYYTFTHAHITIIYFPIMRTQSCWLAGRQHARHAQAFRQTAVRWVRVCKCVWAWSTPQRLTTMTTTTTASMAPRRSAAGQWQFDRRHQRRPVATVSSVKEGGAVRVSLSLSGHIPSAWEVRSFVQLVVQNYSIVCARGSSSIPAIESFVFCVVMHPTDW